MCKKGRIATGPKGLIGSKQNVLFGPPSRPPHLKDLNELQFVGFPSSDARNKQMSGEVLTFSLSQL